MRLLRSILPLFFAFVSFFLVAPKQAFAAEEWLDGPKTLSLPHGVEVSLPDGYRFLGMPEAGALMTKLGNLHNENLLGIVVSAKDDEDYFVSIRVEDDGFIKDDDKLDATEILEAIRAGEDEYNEERKKLGFGAIHAEGWQEEPRYDRGNHHVVWALSVRGEKGTSINLNTRILGRKGYASVNLVTSSDELARYRADGVAILRATSFAPGDRYEDFDAKTDKVAEYGLTGLVLGGAGVGIAKVAKLGILAKFWKGFLALLVAGKKGIVALFAGIAAFARKLFGRKDARPDTDPSDASDSA